MHNGDNAFYNKSFILNSVTSKSPEAFISYQYCLGGTGPSLMMYQKIFVLFILNVLVTGEKDSRRTDSDTDPFHVRKRVLTHNVPTTTSRISSIGDTLVEKFVETLMASERYLKMIESVQRKLTHLDATFHERSTSIMKYSAEILKMLKSTDRPPHFDNVLRSVVSDLDKMKMVMKDRYTRGKLLFCFEIYILCIIFMKGIMYI